MLPAAARLSWAFPRLSRSALYSISRSRRYSGQPAAAPSPAPDPAPVAPAAGSALSVDRVPSPVRRASIFDLEDVPGYPERPSVDASEGQHAAAAASESTAASPSAAAAQRTGPPPPPPAQPVADAASATSARLSSSASASLETSPAASGSPAARRPILEGRPARSSGHTRPPQSSPAPPASPSRKNSHKRRKERLKAEARDKQSQEKPPAERGRARLTGQATKSSVQPRLGKHLLRDDSAGVVVYEGTSDGEPQLSFSIVTYQDGQSVESSMLPSVPTRWLRDSDVSPRSVDPHTRQKRHSSGAFDAGSGPRLRTDGCPQVRVVKPDDDARVDEGALEFFWEPPAGEDEYSSVVPLSALRPIRHDEARLLPASKTWVGANLSAPTGDAPARLRPELELSHAEFQTPEGLHRALSTLRETGLVFLRDVPTDATDDAACELRRVATRIGGLRNTFYGPTWDVKALGEHGRNVAYTNVDLGLHMDLLYFENPPQIQLLHCLRNRVVSGGDSYFVDAFAAAERLHASNPAAFWLLSRAPVAYHYKNDAHHYRFAHPVLETTTTHGHPRPRDLRHVNWSPPFQGPLPVTNAGPVLDALAAFERELRAPELEYRTRMCEGDLVLFDNRRVLHARTAFVEPPRGEGDGLPSRWLKGGYVDGDAAWDILRVLSAERGQLKGR